VFEYHPTAAHWVVAEMIEAVEGDDYRRVVERRIIEPLGLRSFGLGVPESDQEDIAELSVVGDPVSYDELSALIGDFDPSLLEEVTSEVLMAFNHAPIRAVGVPGGGGIATAADLALYYQALLHNPGGMWDPAILADGTGHIRCTLPNAMTGVASNRSLGLVIAGDDGLGAFRGMGPTVLTGFGGITPAISPDQVRQIGIRSVDPGEKRLVQEHGLDIYDMRYIDEVGMRRAMEEALEGMDANTHLHVSFDVDMLDPAIAPGTGTRVPGGVNYREAQLIMEMVADSGCLGSLDLVEINPALDRRNATAKLAVDLVESLFGKSTLMRD